MQCAVRLGGDTPAVFIRRIGRGERSVIIERNLDLCLLLGIEIDDRLGIALFLLLGIERDDRLGIALFLLLTAAGQAESQSGGKRSCE